MSCIYCVYVLHVHHLTLFIRGNRFSAFIPTCTNVLRSARGAGKAFSIPIPQHVPMDLEGLSMKSLLCNHDQLVDLQDIKI